MNNKLAMSMIQERLSNSSLLRYIDTNLKNQLKTKDD